MTYRGTGKDLAENAVNWQSVQDVGMFINTMILHECDSNSKNTKFNSEISTFQHEENKIEIIKRVQVCENVIAFHFN